MTVEAPSVAAVSEPNVADNQVTGLSAIESNPDAEWQAVKEEMGFPEDAFSYAKQKAGEIDKTQPQPKEPSDKQDLQQKVKLKVNGKEFEQPLSEVVKMAQMYQASETKLENLKQAKQQVDQTLSQVQQAMQLMRSGNPEHISQLFKNLGVDFNKLAAQHVKKLFDLDMMHPEQRKAYELEQQVKQFQEQQKHQQQMEQQRIQQYHDQKAAEELQIEIPKALKEVSRHCVLERTQLRFRLQNLLKVKLKQSAAKWFNHLIPMVCVKFWVIKQMISLNH